MPASTRSRICCATLVGIFVLLFSVARAQEPILLPQIVEPWLQVAGDPDLGEFTSEGQQPVDFGVWQARDGTWQLWSCIRKTKCGGIHHDAEDFIASLMPSLKGIHIARLGWVPQSE